VLTRCGLRRERAKAGVVGAQPDQLGSWAILRSPIVSYFGTVESGCGVEPMCGEELEMFHPPSPPRPLFRAHRSCRRLFPVWADGTRNADGCDSTRSALPPISRLLFRCSGTVYTCLLLCIWGRRHEASFPCLSARSRDDECCEGETPEAWVTAIERDLWRLLPRTSHRVPCVAPLRPASSGLLLTNNKRLGGRGPAGERTAGSGRWQQGLSMARGVGSCQAGPSFVGVLTFNFSCIISHLEGASSSTPVTSRVTRNSDSAACKGTSLTANQQTSIRTTHLFGTVHRNSSVDCHRSNRQEVGSAPESRGDLGGDSVLRSVCFARLQSPLH
jgi:hypothetical protein